MNGQWDFTIGLRETRDLYLLLMREKWRGGILGFGAAGALTAVLYTGELGLSPPLRAAAVLAGAGLVMLLAWACLPLVLPLPSSNAFWVIMLATLAGVTIFAWYEYFKARKRTEESSYEP